MLLFVNHKFSSGLTHRLHQLCSTLVSQNIYLTRIIQEISTMRTLLYIKNSSVLQLRQESSSKTASSKFELQAACMNNSFQIQSERYKNLLYYIET